MWFDSDKPAEEKRDLHHDLIDHAHLMAGLCLLGYVGFVVVVVL